MTITRHLDGATLMSFAAGSLPQALAAVAAAHVSMCARCRDEVAFLESVGGALLAGMPQAALARPAPAMPAIGAPSYTTRMTTQSSLGSMTAMLSAGHTSGRGNVSIKRPRQRSAC